MRRLTWPICFVFNITSFCSLFSLTVEEMSNSGAGKGGNQQSEFAGKSVEKIGESQTPYKDPRLACLLSLVIPGGGGHFYLRNDMKGALFCLSVSVGYLAAAYFIFSGFVATETDGTDIVIGAISGLAGMVFHILSMVEAYNDAVKINESKFYRQY